MRIKQLGFPCYENTFYIWWYRQSGGFHFYFQVPRCLIWLARIMLDKSRANGVR
jgi:hypothetical protein